MKVVVMIGTRPEVIKMAPVIMQLRNAPRIECLVCATGQHKEMLAQALADFALKADINLEVMSQGQSLGQLSGRLFEQFDNFLEHVQPDWLLVQGDTTSVMAAGLCAFYRNIKIGHVEAGLRSFKRREPFPEEINRKIVALVGDAHFAPTEAARANLLAEGIADKDILVTGNTVTDALKHILKAKAELPGELEAHLAAHKQIILLTAHRRENHGEPLKRICAAVTALARQRPEAAIVYPVHFNPAVRETVMPALNGFGNILLIDPLPYKHMLHLTARADIVLTDSGGLQEEAAILRKPCLVLRETTERMEGVHAGAATLVGSDSHLIRNMLGTLLDAPHKRAEMAAAGGELYGDGNAASRIVAFLQNVA